jgi:hypothetical protein
MTMRIHKAEDRGAVLHYCIHLDETKTLDDGTPDPAYLRTYEWGKTPPLVNVLDALGAVIGQEPQSEADYHAAILREMKLLADLELAQTNTTNTSTPLPVEGNVL